MLIVNVDYVSDKELTVIGLVQGASIQLKHIGQDLTSGLKTLEESRIIALDRMEQEAAKLSADAIVNVRFATNTIQDGTCEILAYGTAVKYKVRNDLQQF